jgi:NADH:ubiquinone oxidoreductase subunit 6 (subunit J)
MLETILFYFFSLLAVGGGILTVTCRTVVICGVWLIVSLLGVAGLFLLEGAEFLFIAQLILYVGGVVLLFIIAVAGRILRFRYAGRRTVSAFVAQPLGRGTSRFARCS